MITDFEIGLVRHLLAFDKGLKRIEFSNNYDTNLDILGKSVQYPVCLVERQIGDDTVFPKSYDYEDRHNVSKFFTMTITYRVKIWYEKMSTALVKLQRLRFFFEKNPYIYITDYTGDDKEGGGDPNEQGNNFVYHFGMRFMYIGIQEDMYNDNPQGARRCVIATFQSTIPFDEYEEFKLIEYIKLGLNGIEVYSDGHCFKSCPLHDTTQPNLILPK